MGGPAFSFGSLGSGPTAIVPGNGFRWRMIPGLNSVVMVFASSLKYCTCPSGNSEASKPTVGNCLPGRLKLKPESLITIFLMRISMVSPGSAPFTKMGPVTECGPPPGLARRSLTISSIEAPGLTSSIPWLHVSMETVSPESTISFGFSVGSNQPHCTVALFAGSEWCLPVTLFAAGFSGAVCAFVPAQIMLRVIKRTRAQTFLDELIGRLLFTGISKQVQEV